MALWNPKRSPDKYEKIFHFAVTSFEPTIIAVSETRKGADHQRKRFNAFKACLRNYPLYSTSQVINSQSLESRVKVIEVNEGFAVQVTTRTSSLRSLKLAIDILD
jgi:hypothetical protein